jgi:hypothetical protein
VTLSGRGRGTSGTALIAATLSRCSCSFATLVAVLVFTLFDPSSARAWGERGHQIVTEVAIRLIVDRAGDNPALSAPLLSRRGLLCHLANVPDIVWRSEGPDVVNANGPTHFVGLEDLVDQVDLIKIPFTFSAAACAAKAHGHDLATQTGTAPWRVAQLANVLEASLRRIHDRDARKDFSAGNALASMVNESLVWAGLLSHFVGDLSQPDHVSTDFDGWKHGQGGIHSFIDSDIVDVQPLDLAAKVYAHATAHNPFALLLKEVPEAVRASWVEDPLRLAFALAVDAFQHREEMFRLDRELAVIAPSEAEPHRTVAKRRSAGGFAAQLEPFVIERLAVAADTLAQLWQNAWDRAGRPDLRSYHSYAYPLRPDFLGPSYITEASCQTRPAP